MQPTNESRVAELKMGNPRPLSWTSLGRAIYFEISKEEGPPLTPFTADCEKNFFPKNRNVVIYLGVTAVLSGLWKKEEGEGPPHKVMPEFVGNGGREGAKGERGGEALGSIRTEGK